MLDDPKMYGFLAIAVLISIALHLGIGVRLIAPFDLTGRAAAAAWGFVGLSALLVPGTFLLLPLSGRPWADALQWVGYIWMGLFSLIFALLLFREVAWLGLLGAERLGLSALPTDPERRRALLGLLNFSVLAGAGGIGAVGLAQSRRLAKVVPMRLPIAGLPEALHGFRIAQISDLHVGPTIRAKQMRQVVDVVNDLQADIVALTGDLVDGPVASLTEHVAPLKELRSRHGTWFVTGNHEYYSGVHAWLEHIRGPLGMTALVDEHAVIDHDGASILVAGITDRTATPFEPTHRADVRKAALDAPETDFRLLLAHQPECAPLAAELGFDLQLSGHTHGGQYFPFTLLIGLGLKWVVGLYREAGMWLYVNPGTTYWGPPMRLGSPQEITLLELVPE